RIPNPSASNPVAKSARVPGSGVGTLELSEPSSTFPPHGPFLSAGLPANAHGERITRNWSSLFRLNVLENTWFVVVPSLPTNAFVFVLSKVNDAAPNGFDAYPRIAYASPGCTLPKLSVIEVAPSLSNPLTSNP